MNWIKCFCPLSFLAALKGPMMIQNQSQPGAEQIAEKKESPLMPELIRLAKAYGPPVAIGAIIVIIVLAAVAAYSVQKRRNTEQASRMLALAQNQAQYEEVLRQFPSSSAAPIATLALAASLYSAGAYDQASMHYFQFLQKYPQHVMAISAELGKVMCQEALGDAEVALLGFTAFITAHPDHFLVPQAQFGQARCLQTLKRYPEARAVYEDFLAANPESEWRSAMESALNLLKREIRMQGAPQPLSADKPSA